MHGASTVVAWEIMSEYMFRTRFSGQIVAEFLPPDTPRLAIMLKNLNSVTQMLQQLRYSVSPYTISITARSRC